MLACLRRVSLVALLLLLASATFHADEGWVIDRMQVRIDIAPDGRLGIVEDLNVDFRGLSRHGIFRDIPYRLAFDATRDRDYDIRLDSVTDASGGREQVETSDQGWLRRFRIGDPDRTVSGTKTYRIAYSVQDALNPFPERDELYWNATGVWPVTITAATVVVHAPAGGIERVACYEGPTGSADPCEATFDGDTARFTSGRALAEGEQMTVVVALSKGLVVEPRPHLIVKPRELDRFFDLTAGTIVPSVLALGLVIGGMGALWWRTGRDRRFVSLHYLSSDQTEETAPLFSSDPLAVEFEPPEKLRPGQMGLLADESADTLDATATIIDLAARGYLTITELPKTWVLGKHDWRLDRLKPTDSKLLEYERIILDGLFAKAGKAPEGSDPATGAKVLASRELSDLKTKFHTHLDSAKKALYQDALARKWFVRNPSTVRSAYRVLGVFVAAAGVAATIVLGRLWGAGLLGLPVLVAGVLLFLFAGAMPKKTALGREMLRRSLGFAKYIKTAETTQQAFAERARIFSSYLPYAIVFKCVSQWARAFEKMGMTPESVGWYTSSTGRFDVPTFSSSLNSFSSSVSTTMASTPGGSGSSGFSGGSSGGGGGGGGGGSW